MRLPEVVPALGDRELKFGGEGGDKALQVGVLQRVPDLLVRIAVKWVQVHAQRTGKQNRILEKM